jgi:hypothetical protein
MLLDNSTGIQIYTYEGRLICNPRFQGLRTELLNSQMITLSNDSIAVLDQQAAGTTVRFFDTAQVRGGGPGAARNFGHTCNAAKSAAAERQGGSTLAGDGSCGRFS